jgi:Flp pilus assembly protein TadG
MIFSIFRRFSKTRRSAIAVTMAVTLVPLVLLIGIAVDVTFVSQDRIQATFASQSAAVAATRVATATYALEVANSPTESLQTAAKQAIDAANEQGGQWFYSDLGSYSRGTLLTVSPNTTFDNKTTGAADPTLAPNFTATVSDTSSYSPIFNHLFGSSQPWVAGSSGVASTQYSYAEILLMLDTSQSMMIGADPSDITTMEDISVCPQYNWLISTDPLGNVPGQAALSDGLNSTYITPPFPGSQYDVNTKQCDPLNGKNFGVSPSYVSGKTGTTPETACALACHFSNTMTTDGYTADLYGMARRKNVTLRIDVLFTAAQEVIQNMISSQATSLGQLSVGVYQFNTDIGALVNGNTGTGGQTPEATSDLTTALNTIEADNPKTNFINNPANIPQLTNATTVYKSDLSQAADGDTTDLVLAMKDFLAGKAFPTSASGNVQSLGASGSGNTPQTPVKYVFIVTDGMEDENLLNGGRALGILNYAGDMTSVQGEATTGALANTGTCSKLKQMGYTVYVLYVQYYPLAETAYYGTMANIGRTPSPETLIDYPTDTAVNSSVNSLTNETAEATTATSPTALALQACASAPTDFESASSSTDIQTDLQAMLKQALASSIRLTN